MIIASPASVLRSLAGAIAVASLVACSADDADGGPDTSAAAAAAASAPSEAGSVEERVITVDTTLAEFARYSGELPCDDCEAVRTELRLWADPHRYMLSETYVGGADGDTTLVRIGEWLELRGTPTDSTARVVQLRFETAGEPRSFVMIGGGGSEAGGELQQLSEEQRPMAQPERWTLDREGSGG